jgi:hypothetical protein
MLLFSQAEQKAIWGANGIAFCMEFISYGM